MINCDFGKIIEKSLNCDNPFCEDQLNETGNDLLNFLANSNMSLNRLGGYWKNQSYIR